MNKTKNITQEIVKELLDYNQETGIFTWKERDEKWFNKGKSYNLRWNKRFAGKQAGDGYLTGNDGKSYVLFAIFGVLHRAHRIAWLYMTGNLPSDQIDHINGNGCDNRFCNLREVNNQINGHNVRKSVRNSSGTTGVSWNRQKSRWDAYITVNKKKKSLGRFKNLEDAINIRKAADLTYNYHHNHGTDRPL